jgi:ornithine cyclodeaminase/alanine dehydrogenase-like protein (mu-crystallin family)
VKSAALLLNKVEGRQGTEEVTLFKSFGLAIEDLVAAHKVYLLCLAAGAGIEIDL